MRIKKHTSGNEYILADNVWVRNFTKDCLTSVSLSHLFDNEDYSLILKNQELNKNYPKISNEKIIFKKVVVISDGYDFDNRHLFLSKLPKDVAVLAVNKALAKWKLMIPGTPLESRRTINAFVMNNPYKECFGSMPKKESKYYPVCLASTRTNYEFLKKYPGEKYTYAPTPEVSFGFDTKERYYVDDYRNPICAAIDLAYHFKAEKVMLLCCDDSFKDKRESSVELPNGLYTYPQHLKTQKIIDAKIHWLTHQEDKITKVADYSSGAKYVNAVYISSEEDALSFFSDQEEGLPNVN
jgi:hypothetical protein